MNKFGEQVDSFFAEGSMSRILLAGGLAAALMGASLSVPVVVAWLERGRLTGRGIGFLAAAAGFVAVGVTAVVLAVTRGDPAPTPPAAGGRSRRGDGRGRGRAGEGGRRGGG